MILAVFLIRNPITTDDPTGFQPTLSRLLSTSTFYPKMELTIPCYHGTPRHDVIQLGKRLIEDFLHSHFFQRYQQIRTSVPIDMALSNMKLICALPS